VVQSWTVVHLKNSSGWSPFVREVEDLWHSEDCFNQKDITADIGFKQIQVCFN
jgi:hypothetical protein